MDDSDEEVLDEVKVFLEDFPKIKLQLEKYIKELHLATDKIDKIHKNCTITRVVASSAGAVSCILTIAALALAPVTAGASLALFVVGMGLGATAAVTGVSARVVDHVSESWGKSHLDNVEGKTNDILSKSASEIRSLVAQLHKTFKNITLRFHDLRMLRSRSISTTPQTNRAFPGTALAMTKKARIRGDVFAGVFVLMDIAAIVEDFKDLPNGAKSTTAEKLRKTAQDLEERLQELSKIYQTLLEMDTQSRT